MDAVLFFVIARRAQPDAAIRFSYLSLPHEIATAASGLAMTKSILHSSYCGSAVFFRV